jgi:Holliday junction DNA helicase RuvA
MIISLTGKLAQILDKSIIIDVNGVGYEVFVPESMGGILSTVGQQVTIYIYHHIKEDSQVLYGFPSLDDRHIFMVLTSISGIGPKVGIKFLSTFSSQDLVTIIANQDFNALTAISGVGKKLAERVVVELKDKMSELKLTLSVGPTSPSSYKAVDNSYRDDLMSALKILGYSQDEIKRGVDASSSLLHKDMSVEDAIRVVLKSL